MDSEVNFFKDKTKRMDKAVQELKESVEFNDVGQATELNFKEFTVWEDPIVQDRVLSLQNIYVVCRKNFMSRRMANFEKILEKHSPSKHVQGTAHHHRLFKIVSPKMWNFTACGAIIANCSGLEELFQNKVTCQLERKDVSTLKAADLFIGTFKGV